MGVRERTRPNLFELLARLPPRVWLQAALGLIGFAVLAVLGFAVIAGFVAVVVVVLLLYRLRAWLMACLAAGRQAAGPHRRAQGHRRPLFVGFRASYMV